MNYTINDKTSLMRLLNDSTLKRTIRSITIEPRVPSVDIRSFERKINRYYFACGCTFGQIAVLCTLSAYGLLWLIYRVSPVWWKVVAAVFCSALAGKIIALVISRYLLRRTYADVEHLVS